MNAQVLEQARSNYRTGDFAAAVAVLRCQRGDQPWGDRPSPPGNSLMRLGRYAEAARECYAVALRTTPT